MIDKKRIWLQLIFWLISFPLTLFAQLDHVAIVTHAAPDFGAVSGTWGPLQLYRPFGIKAIVLDDWRDLTTSHLINGEPFNTDRQGWLPLDMETLWSQMHPNLTAEADTAAPSVVVNYKQGDGDFKDFTLWYHNSLGKATRYGWNSKLRSHQRFSGVTQYNEQRHRFQLENQSERKVLRIEMGYDHQINPLYMSELDSTTQVWIYNDSLQIRSDRWDGNFHWQNTDSNSAGTEIFAWVQGGIWEWPVGSRQSVSSLAYLGHRFKLGNWSPAEVKVGVLSKQLGSNRNVRYFQELNLPALKRKYFSAKIGVRNLGIGHILPKVKIDFSRKPIRMSYETRHLVDDQTWNPALITTTIHHFKTSAKYSAFEILAGYWQGQKENQAVSGSHGQITTRFPWMMQLEFGGSIVDAPVDWVWTQKQVNWELTQDIILFDQALYGHLKLWGRHLFQPQFGFLDQNNLLVQKTSFTNDNEFLHLLNYTIQAQVSTLIIGFTDSNILQDPMWSQMVTIPWDLDYPIMVNQLPETRFRYLSLIWVFDN